MIAVRLLPRGELLVGGTSPRAIASAVRAQQLVKVRPGFYVDGGQWRDATPEQRIVARARALHEASQRTPVASHETAAAIRGLGLYRPHRDRVHVTVPDDRPGAAVGVIRHRGDLPDDEIETVSGLLCTSLERTVADVARTASFDQAVTVADAALHALCVTGPGEYDRARAAEFRRTALEIARRFAHGVSRAERVLAFADGRANRPGESVSRIRLRQLGFRRILLQVPVENPWGREYFVDFWLEEVRAFGEFDGAMKYRNGQLLDGRTTAQVFDEEKKREDWIRGRHNARFPRWGWPHIGVAADLGRRLAAFGIAAPS